MKIATFIWLIGVLAGVSIDAVAQKAAMPEDAPTVVTLRPPTDDEQEFTKEFARRYPNRKKIKLSEFMPQAKDFGIGLGGYRESMVDVGETSEQIFNRLVNDLTCKSDIVLIARPVSRTLHLSSDESFIYTEYAARVEEAVLGTMPKASVGDSIKLAWPGGKISLNDRTIEARDFGYPRLRTDVTYLLFLQKTSDSRGFLPTNADSAYEISDGSVRPSMPGGVAGYDHIEKTSFISRIRGFAPACQRGVK